LWLTITPTGSKIWRSNYILQNEVNGNIRLGKYPSTTLAKARTENSAVQHLVAEGGNPKAEKEKEAVLVQDFIDTFYNDQIEPNYKDPSQPRGWLNQISKHFYNRNQ